LFTDSERDIIVACVIDIIFTFSGYVNQVNLELKFAVNAWAGIIGDMLISPHILPAHLTGQSYLHFLEEDLPLLLKM
jgi:hypothetical protein